MHRFSACVLLSASLAAGACSSDLITTPTETSPTTTKSETFTGTLTRNGAHTFPFSSNAGTVQATLSALAPDTTLLVGFSLGTWNSTGGCQIVLANDKATAATVVVGNAGTAGNLCVRIYDVGNLVQPESFQIDVVHF